MRAGRYSKRVTIQQVTETVDGYGARTETWSARDVVWAAIWPIAGREYLQSGQIIGEVSHRITLRYKAGITPKMRILFDGRLFTIVSVIDFNEKHRELQLMCLEVI